MPNVTKEQLQAGRRNLRAADHGVVSPKYSGIRARRGMVQSAAEYYDHMLETRRAITRLDSEPVGSRMLSELNSRTSTVSPPTDRHNAYTPNTSVDIYAHDRRGHHHAPRTTMFGGADLHAAEARMADRYKGVSGPGQASEVKFDAFATNDRGDAFVGPQRRAIGLGHELVHAWRASHGMAVSPPEVSMDRHEPLLHPTNEHGQSAKDILDMGMRLKEEFETVGLEPTPRMRHRFQPTENLLRHEHGLTARRHYSGYRPGSMDGDLDVADRFTDTRSMKQKYWDSPTPLSPMRRIIKNLTD
jgi:hypothetical protein